jgi:hypothetical protein
VAAAVVVLANPALTVVAPVVAAVVLARRGVVLLSFRKETMVGTAILLATHREVAAVVLARLVVTQRVRQRVTAALVWLTVLPARPLLALAVAVVDRRVAQPEPGPMAVATEQIATPLLVQQPRIVAVAAVVEAAQREMVESAALAVPAS